MKKFPCDRCHINIGTSKDEEENHYYNVSRSSDMSRFGHKTEKYICSKCLHLDERYKKERDNL